jgi:superfamily II DNA or RNA helicase
MKSETTLEETESADCAGNVIPLSAFIADFGDDLLQAVRQQNPPIYSGEANQKRDAVMESLLRKPFEAQKETVQSIAKLLLDENVPAGVINGEMGTGKTLMAIALAALMHREGYQRALVISPPHLVYKWRREIMMTVPGARVWVLNGPDTLKKLLALRKYLGKPQHPEFFVLGRVRMRMGFQWRPAFALRPTRDSLLSKLPMRAACCPKCGTLLTAATVDGVDTYLTETMAIERLNETQAACINCGERLWTLINKRTQARSRSEILSQALQKIPTIGPKTAEKLVSTFGVELLSGMLEDNVYEFINLMDENGDLVFNDRQATRMERAMATSEFSFGQGGYQATEFIKRYLPHGYFGLLIVDEGHEYKNEGSAQGQAMGVLARKCKKTVLLTGTLMGGYADDLFYLLMRMNPKMMIEDGFSYTVKRSLSPASMSFMREHGILKDIYKEASGESHRTAKGKNIVHRTAKGPGFGPKGIMRYVVPYTAFLKLKDIGANVLPPYTESLVEIAMTETQRIAHDRLSNSLKDELRVALRKGDLSLLGVVLNALLAWPDCCFRDELVRHPHSKQTLAFVPAVFAEVERTPKEIELVKICKAEHAEGRRVLLYTVYTGTRDTATRMKSILDAEGFKVAVLRSSVDADKREDWLLEQVDRGVNIVITNPELVKTGLDMLEFPTIVFMQSGYNVYTLQQAARRSWRIGQKRPVKVLFLGYENSAQAACLQLMAKKIAVSQSTSGDMPDSGLDVLNQRGDSIEVAMAKQLVK